MTIRQFEERDRPEIHRITLVCFEPISMAAMAERRYGRFREVTWQERKLADVDADLEVSPQGVWVAAEEGQVLGFVTTRLDERTGIGHLLNLAVDPAHQGKGLGSMLIRKALEYLAENGMTHAKIETLVGNAVGEHLYPKLGFEELTRQIYYMMELPKRA